MTSHTTSTSTSTSTSTTHSRTTQRTTMHVSLAACEKSTTTEQASFDSESSNTTDVCSTTTVNRKRKAAPPAAAAERAAKRRPPPDYDGGNDDDDGGGSGGGTGDHNSSSTSTTTTTTSTSGDSTSNSTNTVQHTYECDAVFGVVGLKYMTNWISPSDESTLLAQIDSAPWNSTLARRVQHYGYAYVHRACMQQARSNHSSNDWQTFTEHVAIVSKLLQYLALRNTLVDTIIRVALPPPRLLQSPPGSLPSSIG
jgi:hypothetical protein